MKINHSALFICLIMAVSMIFPFEQAEARPSDSLRVKVVLKEMNLLMNTVQDSILPKLGKEKAELASLLKELKSAMKKSKEHFKDTMQAKFENLTPEEKTNMQEIESIVARMKKAVPEKSTHFNFIALRHLPVYIATQSMRTDGRTPLLATYMEPYDPNKSTNHQIILRGAFLNFYLEYRMSLDGVEMGPDIVDPERLVFTFPYKKLEGLTEPTYFEVKAAPKKQTGTGKEAKFEDHPEQTAYVLVLPLKKK